MKIKNISHILLSVLFLFAYVSNTVHSTQHLVKELDCHLCVASKQLDTNTHEISPVIFTELTILATVNTQQRISLKKSLTLTAKPLIKRVDFLGMRTFTVTPIPLGYFSNAPPYTFS